MSYQREQRKKIADKRARALSTKQKGRCICQGYVASATTINGLEPMLCHPNRITFDQKQAEPGGGLDFRADDYRIGPVGKFHAGFGPG